MTVPPTSGLGVFAKYPEPGKVKTRLARTVGDIQAARYYERLLGHFIEHTLYEASRLGTEITIFCDPGTPLEKCRELFGFTGFAIESQEGGDLGERLRRAFSHLHAKYTKALIAGTDCIDLSSRLIGEALEKLSENDLCLGPTGDGGYYLIGLKGAADTLFESMPWSTPQVLPLTLERAKHLRLKTALLEPLRDVDTSADWEAIGWRCDEENESIKNLRRKKT